MLACQWRTNQSSYQTVKTLDDLTNTRKYLQAVLRQNIAFFDRLGAGEVTNRISHDVDLIQDGISDKVSVTAQAMATFCSGFIIAFIRQWKLALILSCILPTMLLIFAGGGRRMAKLAAKVVAEYSAAATIAEEVLSSVRTAQAFGTEEKLALQYDQSLIAAQKVGYKKAAVLACMFAGIFTLVYLAYGLAFCNDPPLVSANWYRARIKDDCKWGIKCRFGDECFICRPHLFVLIISSCSPYREFLESHCCRTKDLSDYLSQSKYRLII